jgi:pyochelin biosynthetic protein PchC
VDQVVRICILVGVAGTSDGADTGELWLRRFGPAPAASSRLVCFPHAGGAATYFFPVAKGLAPDVDVVGVQYPGRQDRHREPCLDTVADLADGVVAALRPLADRPLTLFGHSLGATVAFEVARRLEADQVELAGLFASGRRAPSVHYDERVHLRDDAGVMAAVRSLGGTEADLLDDEEVVRMVLPAIRSDYKAAETYRYQPGPRLQCAINGLVGEDDPRASAPDVRAWADHTGGGFMLHTFPGGHFYLKDSLPAILALLTAHLGTVSQGA